MATLFFRKNRGYETRTNYTEDGRYKRKVITLKTKNEKVARVRLHQVEKIEQDIVLGLPYEHKLSWLNEKEICGSLGVVVDEWIKVREVEVRPNHLKRNMISMDRLIDVLGKDKLVADITFNDIEVFKVSWAEFHSNTGININLRAIKTFLNWCNDKGYLDVVPKFKMLRQEKTPPKYITEEQWNLLMATECKDKRVDMGRFKRAWALYRSTGMRRLEPFRGYIDGDFFKILAQDSKTNIEREIPIDQMQKEIILEMQGNLAKAIRDASNRMPISDDKRERVEANHIGQYNKRFIKACKDIGIYIKGKTTLHSLRHTFATMRYYETRDIMLVKEELGHTDLHTTQKYVKKIMRLEQDFPSLKGALGTNFRYHSQSMVNVLDGEMIVKQRISNP